jgi:hypothetical protein
MTAHNVAAVDLESKLRCAHVICILGYPVVTTLMFPQCVAVAACTHHKGKGPPSLSAEFFLTSARPMHV